MQDLTGKVVAVSGAARGLGELARQLTERRARVALLGLEPAELASVSTIPQAGPGANTPVGAGGAAGYTPTAENPPST